jgi:hypothetical protein
MSTRDSHLCAEGRRRALTRVASPIRRAARLRVLSRTLSGIEPICVRSRLMPRRSGSQRRDRFVIRADARIAWAPIGSSDWQ